MLKVLLFVAFIAVALAEEIAQENDDLEPRKKVHHLVHGGLHGLSKFLSLKIKVIVAVVSIAVVAAFFLKIFAAFKLFGMGGCDYPPPPPPPPHIEHVYHAPPVYEHDHHDHHDIAYHSSSGAGSSYPSYSDTYSSPDSGPTHYESSGPYKRKDITGARGLPSFSIADLAFNVINVRSDICRRKFVCEVDQRMKANRLFEYAYSFVSQSIFAKYRETHTNANSYEDCARIYSECNHEIGTVVDEETINTATEADVVEELSSEVTYPTVSASEENVTDIDNENISDNTARLLETHRQLFRH